MSDIRWMQRFDNFVKAYRSLQQAVQLAGTRELSELERQGMIQGFEYTHELAWKVMKDYLEAQGFVGLIGSKNATREAFKNGLIEDGEAWMDMITARNLTSHTYNMDVANGIVRDVISRFYPAFKSMEQRFSHLANQENTLS